MSNWLKFLFVLGCLWSVCLATDSSESKLLRETKTELKGLYEKLQQIGNRLNRTGEQMFGSKKNKTEQRQKRQLAFGGGFGMGFGAYDYNDYYGEYVSDYAYDYYDWICSDTACQLCDILTSECCDPSIDVNCFLPDSCLNNPCLSGGTCITTRTLDNQPDFICVCLPGLTGKYCQLVNDYFVGAEIAFAPAVAAVAGPAAIAGVAADATAAVATDPAAAAGTYVDPSQQAAATSQYGAQSTYGQAAPVQQAVQSTYGQAAPVQQTMQSTYTQAAQPVDVAQLQQQLQAYQQAYTQLATQQQQQQVQQQPAYGQAAAQTTFTQQQQPTYGQATQNLAFNDGQVKVAATKRKRCSVGQIYSAEQQKCVDFSLAQSNRRK